MIIHDWKKDFFTIPNYLSLFRLLLIPVYVLIYLKAAAPSHHAIAAGILALSCLTDLLDGWTPWQTKLPNSPSPYALPSDIPFCGIWPPYSY